LIDKLENLLLMRVNRILLLKINFILKELNLFLTIFIFHTFFFNIKVYEIKGRLGVSTDDFTTHGRLVERATYSKKQKFYF
jgi:hypothetical protein